MRGLFLLNFSTGEIAAFGFATTVLSTWEELLAIATIYDDLKSLMSKDEPFFRSIAGYSRELCTTIKIFSHRDVLHNQQVLAADVDDHESTKVNRLPTLRLTSLTVHHAV